MGQIFWQQEEDTKTHCRDPEIRLGIMQPRLLIGKKDRRYQTGDSPQSDVIFPNCWKNERRDDTNEDAAERPTASYRKIESCQVTRFRFDPREFAMTNHASGKKHC